MIAIVHVVVNEPGEDCLAACINGPSLFRRIDLSLRNPFDAVALDDNARILNRLASVAINESTPDEIERFNRTLSDAFIKQNRMLLAYDIDAFNRKMMDWLIWYNTRRPHWSLGLISPLRYIMGTLTAKESQMCWTST